MKRRSFLRNTTAFTLPAFFGGFSVSAMPSKLMSSMINGDSDRVLVLIDLNGGNDGLNSFVPLDSYGNLFNARQNVIIPENNLLDFTDTIGLHPAMEGVKNLYNNGNLTLVQGVGYPDQNRSHFRSADIWNTGADADVYLNTGWVGRYLDDAFPGYPANYPNADCPDPFAITLGKSISGTCQGMDSNFSMAIIDTNNIGGLTTGVEVDQQDDCYGSEIGFVIETFKKSNLYGERVVEAMNAGSSANNYPDTELAEQMKTVAQLISGGLGTKIYVLKLGGFDTHGDQVVEGDPTLGAHTELLKELSDAIYAFQEDLKTQGLDERVVGMTFSEFGRKIISNAAVGTDHGSAAPMMVFGSCINAGIIGDNPVIGQEVDEEEGVPMQYDFRWIYGSILMDWFEVPEEKVQMLLTNDFQYVPVLSECASSNNKEITIIQDAIASPNPFFQNFNITFNILEKQYVKIDLSDVLGKTIKVITSQNMEAGPHEIYVDTHGIPSGIYFARIQVGNGVKTLRVVKR